MRRVLRGLRCNVLLDIPQRYVRHYRSHATLRRHSRAAYCLSRSDCAAGEPAGAYANEVPQHLIARLACASASELSRNVMAKPMRTYASDVRTQSITKSLWLHGCLTPAFSGAANGTQRTIRTALRGLRCNALLDRVVGKLLTGQLWHMRTFIMLNEDAQYLHH